MTTFFFLVGGFFSFLILIALMVHGLAESLSRDPTHRQVKEVFTKVGDIIALLSISGMYLFWVMPVWYRVSLVPSYGTGFEELSAIIGDIPTHGIYLVSVLGLSFILFWIPAWLSTMWPRVLRG